MSDTQWQKDDAELDEELEDTFPASDPPSITGPEGGITPKPGPKDA
jgi:hypothetical protein